LAHATGIASLHMLVTNVFVNATKQLINTWQTCQQFVYVKHTHLKILCATMPDRFYLKCTRERMHERNKDTFVYSSA